MKKNYALRFQHCYFQLLIALVTCCLVTSHGYGQTFYSKFPNPAGRAYVIEPGGTTCSAPSIHDSLGFADTSASTYSYFTILTPSHFTCTDSFYHFLSNLNVPADTPLLGAGYKAGFHIRIPTGITLDSLRKYTVVSTYTSDGKFVESRYNETIMGSDSGTNGTEWYLYFMATKPFNTVELNVNPNVAPLNVAFEFDVLYAFGSLNLTLPATIGGLQASVVGNSVAFSFQSLTETNVAAYRIERKPQRRGLFRRCYITGFGQQ